MSPTGPIEDPLPQQPSILLVDDDEVNLLLTSIALRERGFAITEALSGDDALAKLSNWVPDVLVLDAMMPGRDGFETCREVRRRPGFKSLPVLMLTGLDDDISITRAYEAGATDFFVKSTQWSLLAGRLRYLLRSAHTLHELERSKAKLARAQDLARMGSFDWRRVAGGLVMSTEGLRVFGRGAHDALTLSELIRLIRSRTERKHFIERLRGVVDHGTVLTCDVASQIDNDRRRIIHVEAEPEFNDHGHLIGYTGIVQDVTDRREDEESIRRLANYDTLTNLPNRRQLIWRSERALDAARRLKHQTALLLIDLDRFKIVNDTLGHAAGDALLVEVAKRLRSCVRHFDQEFDSTVETVGGRQHRNLEAVGRLGGDEFVALLPEVADEQDAERVARRIVELMQQPIFVLGEECFVTASVGIAIYPRDGNSVFDLLRSSDVAMYAVKAQGRNSVAVYSPQLAARGRERFELESALHKAEERGELVLHYQPKIDVRAGRIVGVEALMRWKRGDRLVPPSEFIPLAEDTGLIVPMSIWAIREAARQVKEWQLSFGFTGSVAVNLPNRLFERTDLVEHIHSAATTFGVPHRCIELEITENSLMKDLQNVIPSLHRLNEIGVEISVDDFGTGYSSLAYLTTLPISEVKIDRGFVRDLGMTPQSYAVVEAIIALARSLRLRVVAEGVETLRQLDTLLRAGCTQMQGFLFSRPLPPAELEAWARRPIDHAPWASRVSVPSESVAEESQPKALGSA